jgi:seryl-tRNA synthetase
MGDQYQIKLENTVPEHLQGQVQSKLAYVDELIAGASFADDETIVIDLHAKAEKNNLLAIEAKVQRVAKEMAKGAVAPQVEILEDESERAVPFNQDPMPDLLARGEVSEEHTGIFTFGPLMARLINVFESQYLALADEFDANPYRFPTLISAEKLGRVQYFRAFPHSLTFATHLREDLDLIDDFSKQTEYEEAGLNTPPNSFSRIQALLSPAVCYHLYFALADAELAGGQLAATAVGNCFRYESNNMTSLERMWNFTMREVIFVGSADYVLENREKGRVLMRKVFEEMGLAYHVESANDPFFVGEFRRQAAFQNAFQLKYEVRATLPFKGSTLAVGSYNYHQDFFGRNLNISLPDGSPAHTGCVAFGLERMAYAFLAQYGLDQKMWPASIREAF